MKKLIGLFSFMIVFVGIASADDLSNISLNYCDTPENTIQYEIHPNEKTDICYTVSNSGRTPVTVKIGFVDGTFTNDQWQNKACLSDADTDNFGRYVTEYEPTITLEPGETIQKNATLMYPSGMDGLYHGCIVYSIVDKQQDQQPEDTRFSILMRRAKFIDVIVGDPANIMTTGIILEEFTDADGKNISPNPRIRIYQDESDNTYVVQLKVRNISPVKQHITITGVASNILVYKNMFTEERIILRGESLLITKKIDETPSYNLTLKLNISNTPYTFGNQIPLIGEIKEKTTIWIRNAITFITIISIIIVAGIIVLLIYDIRRRRKQPVIHHKTTKHTPNIKKFHSKKKK